MDEEELRRGPYLQHFFTSGVPHLKYQRLVTLADENQIVGLDRKLWHGGRFVLKRRTIDRQVCSLCHETGHITPPRRERRSTGVLLEGQTPLMPLAGLSQNVLRNYATLFGAFSAFEAQSTNTQFGKLSYIVTYVAPDSA